MRLVRELERRLESIMEGVAGRVFRGPLHPSELAGRVIRQADLSSTTTPRGPVTANLFRLRANPADLGDDAPVEQVAAELATVVEQAGFERGWRLEGPAAVEIVSDPAVPVGTVRCDAEIHPGDRPAWARLIGPIQVPVRVNRAVVGRGSQADVALADDRTSRRHALLWTEGGRSFLQDLGSANGTRVDGSPVGSRPLEVEPGSVITFGGVSYRFEPE